MEEYASSYIWLRQFVDILEQNGISSLCFLKSACAKQWAPDTQIAFVGPCNSGKSTLINALCRSHALPTGMNVDMRIPVRLGCGDNGDSVIVHSLRSGPSRLLSSDDYWEQYSCLPGEKPGLWEDATILRPTAWSDAQLIDTPGWQPTQMDAFETYLNAEILVCVLNAVHLLSLENQVFFRYLKAHWDNGSLFFAVNWINLVPPQEEECLFGQFRDYLQDTWKVPVDEDFLSCRYFGIDAYQAACVRNHIPIEIHVGGKILNIDLQPESEAESGILLFENALREEMDNLSAKPFYSPYLHAKLAEGLRDFKKQAESNLTECANRIRDVEIQINALNQQWKEWNALREQLKWLYQQLLESIAEKAADVYDSFIWDVEADWEKYFSAQKIPFGVVEQAKLAKVQVIYGVKAVGHSLSEEDERKRDHEIRNATSGLTNAIQVYIQSKLEGLDSRIAAECTDIAAAYEQRITRAKGSTFSLGKEQDYFLESIHEKNFCRSEENSSTLIQQSNPQYMLLSILLFQNSTLAYDSLFMDLSPEKLIAEGFYRKIYNLCVTTIFGYVTGTLFLSMIARCLWSIYRRVDDAATMAQRLLLSSKELILNELRQNRNEFANSFQSTLKSDMAVAYKMLMEEPTKRLSECKTDLLHLEEQKMQIQREQNRERRVLEKAEFKLIEILDNIKQGA